ncbi:MAG: FAD-dependent oxidoreductase [Chloroflexi bacterium]|jgi:sulfide:quinone oxidoreductase|nr:FAD-dependent oxidoreductase [Chloroflexota bacterium]MBT4073773.1 FAD-dependent oxidoreductase [Chloroflexota bacterium]MBT4515753.1 FAD-dependent oxidoreductase [Chloroflexota bacterium]MBT6680930.1 FAD-dependent oxidoreductase [Chloroflexota bacterium]
MTKQILILGAGFGGLELSHRLSTEVADEVQVTLIDKNEAFRFGFSKFDLMFGRASMSDVNLYYRDLVKPSVEFRQETVTSIDAASKRVTTNAGTYNPDILVVALGADYDFDSTPGFSEGGHEFYSFDGAAALKDVLADFSSGSIVIGILGQPYKCPPAPCEAAMLLHEYLGERGIRSDVDVSLISQWPVPVPPSPDGSKAIVARFEELGINYVTNTEITSLDPDRKVALTSDGEEIPYGLFLGIPVHRVPDVVEASGMAEGGWIPVDEKNLSTRFPGVYAVGDVTSAPAPKAGVFAESEARAVAEHLIAEIRGEGTPVPFQGAGICYVEFGDNLVGKVNANFLPGQPPTAPWDEASEDYVAEKAQFGAERKERWFSA